MTAFANVVGRDQLRQLSVSSGNFAEQKTAIANLSVFAQDQLLSKNVKGHDGSGFKP